MKRSLVTGGAGFIGSHVAEELVRLGHEVHVVDDLSGGFSENVPPGTQFREGSVSDATFVRDLFSRFQFDYVFHLAAYAAEGLSHFIRRFNYTNNVIGSVNLIDGSVNGGVQCFVFTSSIAAYGNAPLPMTEDTVFDLASLTKVVQFGKVSAPVVWPRSIDRSTYWPIALIVDSVYRCTSASSVPV